MQGARRRTRWLPLVVALLSATGCATAGRGGERDAVAEAAIRAPLNPLSLSPEQFLAAARGTYVVVDLDSNLLRVMDGQRELWEAPVGTGTGLRLQGPDGEWHFTTPRGVFQIQFKEELPIWVLPDWHYVKKGLPIPDRDAPERRQKNQLGIAAVYIGEEIAIHGTDKPELLGQRVSHGCIRLENQYALRLFHNVQVGTPVVIVGGEHLENEIPEMPTDPGKPGPRPRDPLAGVSTGQLLERLERELSSPRPGTAWVPLASRLITRGLKDDAIALRGVLKLAGSAADERLNREFDTFLADAFSRGSLRTVVSLARIDEEARRRAAEGIVRASLSLHPGAPEDAAAPWPTRRVPPGRLGPDGRAGWKALAEAEAEYRSGTAATASREKGGA